MTRIDSQKALRVIVAEQDGITLDKVGEKIFYRDGHFAQRRGIFFWEAQRVTPVDHRDQIVLGTNVFFNGFEATRNSYTGKSRYVPAHQGLEETTDYRVLVHGRLNENHIAVLIDSDEPGIIHAFDDKGPWWFYGYYSGMRVLRAKLWGKAVDEERVRQVLAPGWPLALNGNY